jgi:hypothetical protein
MSESHPSPPPRRVPLPRIAAAALAAAALVPATAPAATVDVGAGPAGGPLIVVEGGPGADALTVANDMPRQAPVTEPVTVRVTDDAGPVTTADPACAPAGPREVRCRVDGIPALRLDSGPGADRVSLGDSNWLSADEHLGDGADTFAGSRGHDHVRGGTGDDVLAGNDGFNVYSPGTGRDVVRGGPTSWDYVEDGDRAGAVDADRFDGGGGGNDHVGYGERTAPLDIDLRRRGGGQGERGEGDALSGFEEVTGGRGADRLTGTDGPELLTAGRGRGDVLIGRGGRDWLQADAARLLDGGAGDDRVEWGAGGAPEVRCGPGRDSASVGYARDATPPTAGAKIARDCPLLSTIFFKADFYSLAAFSPHASRVTAARRVTFRVPCGFQAACRGRLDLHGGPGLRARIASRAFRAASGGPVPVTLRLPRATARRARRSGTTVAVRLRPQGGPPPVHWRVRIR